MVIIMMREPKPSNKLETDKLPPSVEIAQREYLADLAFEERLLDILECTPTDTYIDVSTTSTEALYPGLLTHNSEKEELTPRGGDETISVPVTAFRVIGKIHEEPGKLAVNLHIHPEFGSQDTLIIESTDNNEFYLFPKDSLDLDVLSTAQLADLTLRAAGIDQAARQQLFDVLGEHNPSKYRPLVAQLWKDIAERSGTIHQSKTLDYAFPDDSFPQRRAKLRREIIETPNESRVNMTLEYVIVHPDIDAEEAYVLELHYVSVKAAGRTTQEAHKYTVSGIDPMQLTSLRAARTFSGTVEELEVNNNPLILDLFINTFDTLLTA